MYRRTFLSATAVVMSLIGGTASADLYNFGAIAFDQDSGQWAYSYDWSSRQQAAADAMQRCKGHCKVIGEFWNSCGSLAANKHGTYGWDGNIDENAATRRALANCNKLGSGCEIKVTVCNSTPKNVYTAPYHSPEPRPSNSCWYKNGGRVPGCKD
jgi:hypothetical protein